jgi:uncharacterized repeat protein (TIGR03803 family)
MRFAHRTKTFLLSAATSWVLTVCLPAQGLTVLHAFGEIGVDGTNSDGFDTRSDLVLSGNLLYGTAPVGGTNGYGTIFSIDTDGTGFKVLHSFTGASDGIMPNGDLVLCGNTLYGLVDRGTNLVGYGSVFSMTTNGDNFNILYTFTDPANGAFGQPNGGLILCGGMLYGTTWQGGISNQGTIFSLNTNGTFALLHQFAQYTDGQNPLGRLVLANGTLFGTARNYGTNGVDTAGNVESTPAQLDFTVTVPWFREPRLWTISILGLAVGAFFAALALNRHRQLLLSHAAVERKVAERTRELEIATSELLHSQKMNALGTLAAGIAHDFNNILSIIKGSAQIIEDNLDAPQKILTRVDRIKTIVQQGAEIVDAMLGFSRGADAVVAPCNVNVVVADTMKLLGDRFLRTIEVKFERAENLHEILVPREFIQQILLNFIFNASEAMSERKEIILATSLAEELPPGIFLTPSPSAFYVLISVRDIGGGIAPEIMSRIFEPFFTTKAFSARRGTGLGLSMVYELAKKMGAGLAVNSAVGQGSTFTLILPASKNQHHSTQPDNPIQSL